MGEKIFKLKHTGKFSFAPLHKLLNKSKIQTEPIDLCPVAFKMVNRLLKSNTRADEGAIVWLLQTVPNIIVFPSMSKDKKIDSELQITIISFTKALQ